MIVDSNGKIFEDRRKKDNSNRRKNTFDAIGGRRKQGRRKEDLEQENKK